MRYHEIAEQIPVAGPAAALTGATGMLSDPRLRAAQLAQQKQVQADAKKNLQDQIRALQAQLRTLQQQLSNLNRTP